MLQIIVTGGRTYKGVLEVYRALDALAGYHAFTRGQTRETQIRKVLLIQGGATGADEIAKCWALDRGLEPITVEAEWTRYGKGAGPRRNREMLMLYPEALILAFPGGFGTADCIRQAKSLNRVVLRVEA